MPSPQIYQFHVWLRGISPLIWRRLLLRSDQSIADLHYTLQIAFGWSGSPLHNCRIHGKDYDVWAPYPEFSADQQWGICS